MKLWLPLILVCGLMAGCASNHDAPFDSAAKPSQPQTASGDYTGTWSNPDDVHGTLHLTLKKPAAADWDATMSFTYDNNAVSTTTKSVEVKGNHIQLVYEYDLQDTKGMVEMTGDLSGDTWQGAYKILKGDGAAGTWKATRTP